MKKAIIIIAGLCALGITPANAVSRRGWYEKETDQNRVAYREVSENPDNVIRRMVDGWIPFHALTCKGAGNVECQFRDGGPNNNHTGNATWMDAESLLNAQVGLSNYYGQQFVDGTAGTRTVLDNDNINDTQSSIIWDYDPNTGRTILVVLNLLED